jgi:enamine deaminase RidA (YjgF/YER057c/UK114 family)
MESIRQRIAALALVLPPPPPPVGAYVQAVRSGNLVFLSGGLPVDGDKRITGKVGVDLDVRAAQAAARLVVLNRLAVLQAEIGSLDKVRQIVAVNGFVNCGPEFTEHPAVLNGASELLVGIFGERGRHSRTAVGVSSLPFNVAVELNLVVEVE